MSASVALHSAAKSRNRSTEALRAAHFEKLDRERLIVDYLDRGVSVPEIAARVGVTEKHMRAMVKDILARRMPSAPAEYVALQVSRLNEALLVAYSAMAPDNLKAVAQVVRIVRELDRYHGFAADGRRAPSNPPPVGEASDPPAVCPPPLAGKDGAKRRTSGSARPAAPLDIGLEKAAQTVEKTDSTPGIGAGSAAPGEKNLSRLVEPGHNPEAPDDLPQMLPDAPHNDHFQAAPQTPEKAASPPEDAPEGAPPGDGARACRRAAPALKPPAASMTHDFQFPPRIIENAAVSSGAGGYRTFRHRSFPNGAMAG